MASASSQPIIPILPYQRAWIEDKSPFKIWLKSRQIGGSFAATLEAVLACAAKKERWVVLSRGERQAKALIEEASNHARAIGAAVKVLESSFWAEEMQQGLKQLEVEFPNGARITGLPANPDTARGFAAHVILDEFAFHADSRKIWRALMPTITRGYRVNVVSTANGMQNMFYELWSGKALDKDVWARHKTDVYEAQAQGLKIDIDQLRAGMNDPDGWAQEFECQFVDEATAYLTWEMIGACEEERATIELPKDFRAAGPLFGGMDIGRKRDLSVIWLLERVGDVSWTRMVKVIDRAPFRVQKEILFEVLSMPEVRRFAIDATGIGAQLAEEAQERFGKYKVEAVTFTQPVKEDLSVRIRRRFEDKLLRIPADRQVREDLHAVKKYTTAAGNTRFDADRTEAGHSDRYWSLALAEMAGSGPTVQAAEVRIEPETRRHGDRETGRQSLIFGERQRVSMRDAIRSGF